MLVTLQIENYALLERVLIRFGPGLNVLSGETGSGKSILVDALGLLLGERAEAGVIRSGATQATVTGRFTSPFPTQAAAAAWCQEHGLDALEPEIRLRREIGVARSRAFLDHQMATLGLLRDLAGRLGEIHSQNEALVSFTPAAQLRLLDHFARLEGAAAALGGAYTQWHDSRARLEEQEHASEQAASEADLWRFQAEEIDAVAPKGGEEETLATERQILAHAGRVLSAAQSAYGLLYDEPEAATAQLKAALRQLQEWQRFDSAVEPLARRLEAVRAEVDDIALETRRLAERVDAAPGRLTLVEDRLAALERLRRKYGPTFADVLAHRERLASQLESLAQSVQTTSALGERAAAADAEYQKQARAVSARRRKAAVQLAHKLEAEVAALAMTLRFEVVFEQAGANGPTGWDRVCFMASTNPGEPLQPVAEIASGGELSRLLLALHLAAEANADGKAGSASPRTLVLDEIDAGIGGRAAAAVGDKLQRLGEHYQVLCVTHLAPIACYADTHLRVEKQQSQGRTVTAITTLEGAAREAEIARMLAGNSDDPTALRHARELLAGAHNGRSRPSGREMRSAK